MRDVIEASDSAIVEEIWVLNSSTPRIRSVELSD